MLLLIIDLSFSGLVKSIGRHCCGVLSKWNPPQ